MLGKWAVQPVEGERRHRRLDRGDRAGGQRDQVRVAAHEADFPPVRQQLDDIAGQQRAAPLGTVAPMQHGAAIEMAGGIDQGDAVGQRVGWAGPEMQRGVRPHDMGAVGFVDPDRALEGVRPLDHRRIEMRVRNGDGADAAKRAHQGHGGVVQQRDAVPQDVALRTHQQQRPLANREGGGGANPKQAGLAHPPGVGMVAAQFGQGSPALAGGADILPLVVTDRAGQWGCCAGGLLGAAGDANEGGHDWWRAWLSAGAWSRSCKP